MVVITIVLDNKRNTDGSFKNKQVIKCGQSAFLTAKGTPMNSLEIAEHAKAIAYDIHRPFYEVSHTID